MKKVDTLGKPTWRNLGDVEKETFVELKRLAKNRG